MIGTQYKPRPSAYTLAYNVIRDIYIRGGGKPLSVDEVHRKLTCTPGIRFAEGVTLDDVINQLVVWKLAFKGTPSGLEGDYVIPLDWPKEGDKK